MKGFVAKRRRTTEILEGIRDLQKRMTFGEGRQLRELVEKTNKLLELREEISDDVFELQRAYDALVELVEEAVGEMELDEENLVIAEKDADRKEYDKEYGAGRRLGKKDMLEGGHTNDGYMDKKNETTFAKGYRSGVLRIQNASRKGRVLT